MDTQYLHDVAALFDALWPLAPEERAEGLEAADPVLRRDVEEMLAHHDAADAFLEPTIGAATTKAGDHLDGYDLIEEIGAGSMGRVFLATKDANRVALKLLHPQLRPGENTLARFRREAEIGQRVVHPNVVRTREAGFVNDVPYLVMDYVEGQTLDDLRTELGLVPEELCRHVAREVTQGLGAIHAAGVVHRDIKPSNVLLTPDHQVKVMDLGVAYLPDDAAKLTMSGTFLGSLAYAAPEQFLPRDEPLDGRTDLYSLGVVLYELLSGEHPFTEEDMLRTMRRILEVEPRRLGDLNPQVSPFLEEVVHVLLAKDRTRRIASAEALLAILEAGEEGGWWAERAQALRAETGRPLRRMRIPRETAVYGRDTELATLQTLYERARDGEGQVLLLEGEAGIGKTRLIDEFVGRLKEAGEAFHFLFGSYPPGGGTSASGAFAAAFREHLGAEDLESALGHYLEETPSLIPAFSAMLRGAPPPDRAAPLSRDVLHTVYVHLARTLSSERPTVIVIDDLHFGGDEGRALFKALALAVRDQRLLLIATTRPGVSATWLADLERLEPTTRLALTRMGPLDLANMLVDAFRSERLAQKLGFKIAQKSDGNPFFALEIIRGLKEGQLLRQNADGTWATTKIVEELTIPSSVVDLVQARTADLDEDDRETLDVAACCGFEFDPDWIAETLGVPRIKLLRRLARIERSHGLVRAVGPRFVFDHHQIQEALYESMPEGLRREYHAALADTLETRAGDGVEGETAASLSHHFLLGRQARRALPHLDPALTYLERAGRSPDAVVIASEALAAEGLLTGAMRCRILLRLQKRLDVLGRREPQREACAEALALADTAALRLRALVAQCTYLRGVSEYERAREVANEALAVAHAEGDARSQLMATRALAFVLPRLGRLREAADLHARCIELAQDLDDAEAEAIDMDGRAGALNECGEREEALALHLRALELKEALGDEDGIAGSLVNTSLVATALGRFDDARDYAERGLELARKVGNRMWAGNACMSLGNIASRMGRFKEAQAWHKRSLSIMVELGNRSGEAGTSINLGTIASMLGEREEARERLEHGRRLCQEIGHRHWEAVAISHLSGLTEGREEARDLLLEALALFRQMELVPGAAGTLMSLAAVEKKMGREEDAAAHYEEALELGRESQDATLILGAAAHRAVLPGGDLALALRALAEHREHCRKPALTQILYLLWMATKDRAHLDDAHALMVEQRDALPEAERQAFLDADPLHRELEDAWRAAQSSGA